MMERFIAAVLFTILLWQNLSAQMNVNNYGIQKGIFSSIIRKMEKINQSSPSGIVEIDGSKVFEINGRIKTMLSENIRESGYMTIEEAKLLTLAKVAKIYMINHSSAVDNDMCSVNKKNNTDPYAPKR